MAHRTPRFARLFTKSHERSSTLVANQNINVDLKKTLTTTGASPLLVASGKETVDTVKVLIEACSNVNQAKTTTLI